MGKSNTLLKALVSGVKAFKSPSKDKAEKDRSSNKSDKDQRKGGKDKCLWSLGKSSSRSRDSLSAVAAFLDAPEIKSAQGEKSDVKNALPSSGSHADHHTDASKGLNNIHNRSIPGCGILHCTEGLVQEELAAVRIQAAVRRYLATKQLVRVIRALIRLQAIWRGKRVRKQAAAALRCMQALIKVQALARGHRVRSSELGQLIQKHIQQSRQQKKRPTEGWVSSMASLEQLQAKAQSKQDAVMKRQRALVYAFSEQLSRSTSKQVSSSAAGYQPDKNHWGWAWLERWMAAQQVGLSHNAVKDQHSRPEMVKNKSIADLDAVDHNCHLVSSKDVGGNNHFSLTPGVNDIGQVLDDTVSESHVVEKNGTVNLSLEKTLDHAKCRHEGLQSDSLKDDAVKQSVLSPSLSPPPPPPPPPRVSAKSVTKPSSAASFQSPSPVLLSLQVSTKVAQRAVSPSPPPPPPPPPRMKRVRPPVVHEKSSAECHTGSVPVTCSQSMKSQQSLSAACATQPSGGGKLNNLSVPLATTVLPVLDPSNPMAASLMASSSSLPNEPLPAPSVRESCHDLLSTATSFSPTTSYNESMVGGLMQHQCDSATVSTAKPNRPAQLTSSSNCPISLSLLPQPPVSSLDRHSMYCTPFINPNVTAEDMSDSAEETRSMGVQNDFRETSVIEADATTTVEDCSRADSKDHIADQDEIDMDVDHSDAVNAQAKATVQSNTLNEQNSWDDLMEAENAMEVSTNKHVESSRQGQLTEETSPSLPNYMTTTKSAKAKIRSPMQKVDSPKQPRFDTSKAKIESPKQKTNSPKQKWDLSNDFSKQKAESLRQKADSGVNRRHSLSNSVGKVTPGANKLVRAKSTCQSVLTRVNKSTEVSPCSNGH